MLNPMPLWEALKLPLAVQVKQARFIDFDVVRRWRYGGPIVLQAGCKPTPGRATIKQTKKPGVELHPISSHRKREILQFIRDSAGAATHREISAHTGYCITYIKRLVHDLVQRGLVAKVGRDGRHATKPFKLVALDE